MKNGIIKLVSIVLAVCILAATSVIFASADDTTPCFSVSAAEGKPGDEVKVMVSVDNNPGIVSLLLFIEYSKDDLEYKGYEYKNLFGENKGAFYIYEPYDGKRSLMWYDYAASSDYTQSGEFVELTFLIKDGAQSSDIKVSYNSGDVFDKDFNDVYFNTSNGSVSVTSEENVFAGHSLTLDGKIGLNYFMNLEEEDITAGTTVNFAWESLEKSRTASYTLTADDYVSDLGYYKAKCYIAPAEMTCDITASYTVGGVEQTETDVYSAYTYGNVILSDEYEAAYTEDNYTELSNLVKSMLRYGSKAQTEFSCNTGVLADVELVTDDESSNYYYDPADISSTDITSTKSDMADNIDVYGLAYAGATVTYLTDSSLRLYYLVTNEETFSSYESLVEFNDVSVGAKVSSNREEYIYFEQANIAPADFDNVNVLAIDGKQYKYSILDYVKECLESNDTTGNMIALAKATYYYNKFANAYFV